jgi:hypothetical protein
MSNRMVTSFMPTHDAVSTEMLASTEALVLKKSTDLPPVAQAVRRSRISRTSLVGSSSTWHGVSKIIVARLSAV